MKEYLGFLAILGFVALGSLSIDHARVRNVALVSPGQYVDSAVSTLEDEGYLQGLEHDVSDEHPAFGDRDRYVGDTVADRFRRLTGSKSASFQSAEKVPAPIEVAANNETEDEICSSRFILDTFIRHANEDVTEANKIRSITQSSAVYIRGVHDWECRGMVRFEDGTGYLALFGHHPHSSTEYEVFIDEE